MARETIFKRRSATLTLVSSYPWAEAHGYHHRLAARGAALPQLRVEAIPRKSVKHRTFAAALVSAWLSVVAVAAAEPTVKLTGIAQLRDGPVALLEIQPALGPLFRLTLARGERVHNVELGERLYDVELISIDAKAAKVSVKDGDKITELSIGGAEAASHAPVFRLKDAYSRQVLDLYQEISGRTVITSPSLPPATITATSNGALKGGAAAEELARALGEKGITVLPHFEKFAFAITPSLVTKVAEIRIPPEAAKLPSPAPVPPPNSPQEVRLAPLPPGLVKFMEADRRQILDIFQELAGRTLIVSPALPAAKITLKSQTPLSRLEAVWLIEAALQLCDISVTLSADKFAFVTSSAHVPRVAKFKAPPLPDKDPKAEKFPPGLIKFHEADRAQVLDIYQQLFGQTVLLAPDLPPAKVTLKSQTPLTRDEAAWLIESALHLAGIQCVPAGDNQVKVIREPGADANNN